MGFFRAITTGFINFFGITQPTPQQERRAELFIFSLLILILLVAAAVFALLASVFGHTAGAH